tara:strand:+ start:4486 stop:4728 length:243 start_codon:yes stop_codon:yes gene_type:complete
LKKNTQITIDKNKILQFLKKIFKNNHTSENLLENIDSIKFIEIIFDIERKFNIKIKDDDIIPNNFKNLETVSNLIMKNLK